MKVTKEIKAALKQFADRLPATHKEATRPQTGAELLKSKPDIKGPKGEEIDPTKRYFVAGHGTATNHLKRLIRAYEQGGMPAAVKYLQPYSEFLHTPATEPGAAMPVAPEQPRGAEGFPEGRLEMGEAESSCGNCARCSVADAICPPKKRKARRIAPKVAANV